MTHRCPAAIENAVTPGLLRRLAAMLYDSLLVFALLFVATAAVLIPLNLLFGTERVGDNLLFQLYLLMVWLAFFVFFWVRGGQTLGMRTWRIRVLRRDGNPLNVKDALLRFLCAVVSLMPAGLGLLWVLLDKDKLAWHDRLSGTQLVLTQKRGRK